MAVSTSTFVQICKTIRVTIEVKDTTDFVKTGITAAKKFKPGESMVGLADKDLLKERKRMVNVLKEAKKIKSAKSIEMPKIFIDAYEKSLRFAVKKYGPDPKHKEVKKHLAALKKYLWEIHDYHALLLYKQNNEIKRLQADIKHLKALRDAWYAYAKAFQAASMAAASMPASSSMAPSLWSNMQQCSEIGRQVRQLSFLMQTGEGILKESAERVSDRLYFINQHLKHVKKGSDFLKSL